VVTQTKKEIPDGVSASTTSTQRIFLLPIQKTQVHPLSSPFIRETKAGIDNMAKNRTLTTTAVPVRLAAMPSASSASASVVQSAPPKPKAKKNKNKKETKTGKNLPSL
jgi:hypothetical protein